MTISSYRATLFAVVGSCIALVIVLQFRELISIEHKDLDSLRNREVRDTVERNILKDIHQEKKLRVASIFDHHMVLQRESEALKIWGWCDAMDFDCILEITIGEEVFAVHGHVLPQLVSGDGAAYQRKWVLTLPPMSAGGPYTITITDTEKSVLIIEDIYFGDVFICAGQSNMLFTVGQTFAEREKPEEGDDFDYHLIRHFTVDRHDALNPEGDCIPETTWTVASSESIRIANDPWTHFSAVCWYFGKPLHQEIGVPVGLVSISVNGSPLQTWVDAFITPVCGSNRVEEVECCPTKDNVVWNGMVSPVIEIATKGVIFYQGESNLFGQEYYSCALPLFIESWRGKAKEPYLPFYNVEIAPMYYKHNYLPRFRELQSELALEIGNMTVVHTPDLGDMDSPFGFLHPRNKEELGRRLSRIVLHDLYNYNIHYQSPTIESVEVSSHHTYIEVHIGYAFDTVANGLVVVPYECPIDTYQTKHTTMENICAGFVVELLDGTRFHDTNPRVDGTRDIILQISIEDIPDVNPIVKTVYYGFVSWPKPIVFNSAGFPAKPQFFSLN